MILFILAVAPFFSEVRAFNWGAVTGNGGTTGVYVNNFDWDDQWGYCIGENKKVELGKVSGRKQCLDKCEQETWNGKYPRGCEYSGTYRKCVVFFGKGVQSVHHDKLHSSKSGDNYRCNVNIARGVSFSSSKTETEAERAVADEHPECWVETRAECEAAACHWTGYYCTDLGETAVGSHGEIRITVKTLTPQKFVVKAQSSDTVGTVKQRIYDQSGPLPRQIRLFYAGKYLEDQRTLGSYNMPSKPTLTMVTRIDEGLEGALAFSKGAAASNVNVFVQGFAVLGFGMVLYGAFKHYSK